ncbi:hypothetical protein CORC01_10707, partial [Colletotrichum orchidophilum]
TPQPLPTAVRHAEFQVIGSSPSRRVSYCQSIVDKVETNPPNEAPKMRAAMKGATVGHKLSPR